MAVNNSVIIINMNTTFKSKLQNVINQLPTNISSKNIIDVVPFSSKRFNRNYDVFKVRTSTELFVMKKTTENEILIYNFLNKLKLDIAPSISCFGKVDGDYWICMDYIETTSDTLSKGNTIDLVEKLANLNSSYAMFISENPNTTLPHRSDNLVELFPKLQNTEINDSELDIIQFCINNLTRCTHTLVHDDMIPLNVLITNDSVKIIDWEHGKSAPYTMDLGRLLGDFNIDKPWINPKWEQSLLEIYKSESLAIANSVLDLSNFQRDYYSAKLINYVKVIAAYKSRDLKEDKWYQTNKKQLYSVIKILEQFL